MTGARGRRPLAPRVHGSLALLGALLVTACHAGPPKVVPPPPSSSRTLPLQRDIDAILAAPALQRGTWGIIVESLVSDDTLFALNPHKLMMPASSQKLVTLAVGADQLGWNYTYRTSLLTIGPVQDSVLKGDVVIVGTGDPTFDDWDGYASKRFAEWADALKRDGIRAIEGRIIGDDNAFDDEGLGTGWAWDDLAASFATSVGALQFNENTAQLLIAPGSAGERPSIEVRPGVAPISVVNHALTSPNGPPLAVRPLPRTASIEVTGSIPPTAEKLLRNVSVPNPTLYFVSAFRDSLLQNGIEARGPVVDIDDLDAPIDRANATMRGVIESKSLDAIGTTMMKMSQNLYAETLLKTIGAHRSTIGSISSGKAVIDATLTGWGVAPGEILEVDGSGLSRYNLLTADALATVLRHVFQDGHLKDPFMATLPRAGVDGTLGERMKGTPAENNVTAKTGSFSNARAVAGFLRTADGEPLVVVVIANNYGAPAAVIDDATDAILVRLAQFSRTTPE